MSQITNTRQICTTTQCTIKATTTMSTKCWTWSIWNNSNSTTNITCNTFNRTAFSNSTICSSSTITYLVRWLSLSMYQIKAKQVEILSTRHRFQFIIQTRKLKVAISFSSLDQICSYLLLLNLESNKRVKFSNRIREQLIQRQLTSFTTQATFSQISKIARRKIITGKYLVIILIMMMKMMMKIALRMKTQMIKNLKSKVLMNWESNQKQ